MRVGNFPVGPHGMLSCLLRGGCRTDTAVGLLGKSAGPLSGSLAVLKSKVNGHRWCSRVWGHGGAYTVAYRCWPIGTPYGECRY